MKRIILAFFVLVSFSIVTCQATTWDEPWQDSVIFHADCFIKAKVLSVDEEKGIDIKVIESLAGEKISGKVKITDFYMLTLCSASGDHGPEFDMKRGGTYYFFLKQGKKGEFMLPTPTAGFANTDKGGVIATYRHSYHQCMVPESVYELTMKAIFNKYHGLPYNELAVNEFVKENITLAAAGWGDGEMPLFFKQHAAIEAVYHLSLSGYYDELVPFLVCENEHLQSSAVQALQRYITAECGAEVYAFVLDTTRDGFARVMGVKTLARLDAFIHLDDLKANYEGFSEDWTGFASNLMDPRVCTRFPESVKAAVDWLVALWQ
jgi:hypothetical protein